MSPADHYRESERLLVVARHNVNAGRADVAAIGNVLTAALVHATLAQAGAVFLAANGGLYHDASGAFGDAITGGA